MLERRIPSERNGSSDGGKDSDNPVSLLKGDEGMREQAVLKKEVEIRRLELKGGEREQNF